MNTTRRKPRKRIRATQAAKLFSVCPKTFINRCRAKVYSIELIQENQSAPNSPYLVFEAQVNEQAAQLGIL
jgi:hypothetical protein